MPPRRPAIITEPLFPPERAMTLFAQQLTGVRLLKGRRHSEVEQEEKQWQHVTEAIINKTFDRTSPNPMRFQNAVSGGPQLMQSDFSPRRVPPQEQPRFEARIVAFESLLIAMIKELEFYLPDKEIRGSYEAGDDYEFYKDLKMIIESARNSLFIVDNYLDVQLFDLYVEKAGAAVDIRVLTDQLRGPVQAVALKFSRRGLFELRASQGAHDRHVFLDDRGWVIGQSIKDAAMRKPTYIVELSDPTALRSIYEQIWSTANTIVKS